MICSDCPAPAECGANCPVEQDDGGDDVPFTAQTFYLIVGAVAIVFAFGIVAGGILTFLFALG